MRMNRPISRKINDSLHVYSLPATSCEKRDTSLYENDDDSDNNDGFSLDAVSGSLTKLVVML